MKKEVISIYTVYQHKNKINGKRYFGITSRKPEERWGCNGRNYKSSPHFYSAIQKFNHWGRNIYNVRRIKIKNVKIYDG